MSTLFEHSIVFMIGYAGSNLHPSKMRFGLRSVMFFQEKLAEKTGEEDSSAAEQYPGCVQNPAKGGGNGPSPTKVKVLLLPLPCINLLI